MRSCWRSQVWGLTFAAVLAIGGCRSTRGDAADAFARHDWPRAAELYERVLAEHPGDVEAKTRVVEARTHVVEGLFDESKRNRETGDPERALGKITEAMRLVRNWSLSTTGPLADRIH